jgi:stalled ribosome rescue protein Dom34
MYAVKTNIPCFVGDNVHISKKLREKKDSMFHYIFVSSIKNYVCMYKNVILIGPEIIKEACNKKLT